MHRFLALLTLLLAGLLCAAPPAVAQDAGVDLTPERFAFSPDVPYADDVPSPEETLGYELGTQFTLYAHVTRYLQALADASDRVQLRQYGTTYEDRPLYYLVVTSAENQGRLDAIKAGNQALANPPALSDGRRETLLQEHPVTVSLSYNIHGDEAASTEAAMQVAYRLAAATDDATQQLLQDAVVVMYPTVNPDGRDRYVYWYRQSRQAQVATNPDDLAHDQSWPAGRTNHYLFDLNRDWVWNVHPEMEGLTGVYQEWMPPVHVDYHEQGYNDPYFTMPGTTPRNQLLPAPYVALADTFGRANVRAFDETQTAYATREAFDFFYPSYGSSYPSVMGGIGMLTEQAGIEAGRAIETEDGSVLTLRERVFNHYTTSLATVRASVRNRQRLLQYFYDAHTQETNTLDTEAYLLPDDAGDGYLYDVLQMLRHHGITVERATEDFQAQALDYRTGETTSASFDAGTYVVPADQPRHLFVNTILQRRMAIRDSVMYDMSAWSAPLAYNLDAYSTEQRVGAATEPVETAPTRSGTVSNADARYAYVIAWEQRFAPRALTQLWDAGLRVRAVTEPFTLEGRSFGRGTLVVLRGRNRDHEDLAATMQQVADSAQVAIYGFDTGRSEEGIDLASRDSRPVEAPDVALMMDEPFSTYTSGQLWYLFDQVLRYPVTRIRADALQGLASSRGTYNRYGKADLEDYDVLVLPGAYNLDAVFDSTARASLERWVRGGGTLVATEGSAAFFTAGRSGFTDVEMADDTLGTGDSPLGPYTPYAARSDSAGYARIPGAALSGRLDTTHPLAAGMPDRVYSLKNGDDALKPSAGLQTVGHYAMDVDDVLTSGYASQANQEKLAGQTFAAVEPMGQGRVVFLVDNTQYRMFWRGPTRLMTNAALLVPGTMD